MKKWYQSKTIIANTMTAFVAVLAIVPQLINDLGITEGKAKTILAITLFASNVLNIVLRLFFNKATIN